MTHFKATDAWYKNAALNDAECEIRGKVMREIKFRVWSKEDKVMIYDVNSISLIHGKLIDDDYIFMQYVGLKDKNRKEIYEGDILQWPSCKSVSKVEFKLGEFRLINEKEYSDLSIILNINDKGQAIGIGNIYENPELLND